MKSIVKDNAASLESVSMDKFMKKKDKLTVKTTRNLRRDNLLIWQTNSINKDTKRKLADFYDLISNSIQALIVILLLFYFNFMNDTIWWHGHLNLFENITNNLKRQLLGNDDIKYSNENIEMTQQYFGLAYIIFYVAILLWATIDAVRNKIKELNNQSHCENIPPFFVCFLFYFIAFFPLFRQ